VAIFRKAVTPDTVVSCVSCPTCSFDIPVQSGLRMPREFSVLCPNCGWRREYHPADLHDARPEAELHREFSRIQFGKKNVKKIETERIFIHPKAPLNQLMSWLLQ